MDRCRLWIPPRRSCHTISFGRTSIVPASLGTSSFSLSTRHFCRYIYEMSLFSGYHQPTYQVACPATGMSVQIYTNLLHLVNLLTVGYTFLRFLRSIQKRRTRYHEPSYRIRSITILSHDGWQISVESRFFTCPTNPTVVQVLDWKPKSTTTTKHNVHNQSNSIIPAIGVPCIVGNKILAHVSHRQPKMDSNRARNRNLCCLSLANPTSVASCISFYFRPSKIQNLSHNFGISWNCLSK